MTGAIKIQAGQNRSDTRSKYCFLAGWLVYMGRRNADFSLLILRTGRDYESDPREMYVDVCCRSNVSTNK